eukprot:522875-Pelagomonas_calceolata.AAC.3
MPYMLHKAWECLPLLRAARKKLSSNSSASRLIQRPFLLVGMPPIAGGSKEDFEQELMHQAACRLMCRLAILNTRSGGKTLAAIVELTANHSKLLCGSRKGCSKAVC